MTHEIKYPTEKTYFISYTDTTIFGYGSVNPDQQMDSELPYLWQSTNEEDWLKELNDVFNTIPEPPY
jgi:hypothetical protein|tara:strand:+ start:883 stop:1083 length:201 start_codon:yes stop_codon:yes gene_type:complete